MHFYESKEINIILSIKSKQRYASQCSFLDAVICIYVYNLITKIPIQGYRSHFIFTTFFISFYCLMGV